MNNTATRTILVAQPGSYVATFCPAEPSGKWERRFWLQSIIAWEIERESDADKDWISHTATPITMQGSPTDTGFDDIWAVKGPDGRFDFVDTIFDTEAEALDYALGLRQMKLKFAAQKVAV